MLSASARWVLAYNGEVYNHLKLRRRLEAEGVAPAWRGHSDTETLLAAIEAWGVDETLKRSVGMFALALWDRTERALWLARDRLGEKPLYYGWQGETFLFGSELKALSAHPAFNAAVDRGALALLLRYNYIPAPYSIHAGIRKLPPGTWLRLAAGQREAEPVAYWSLAEVAERGMANPFEGCEAEALDALEQHLGNAVRGQMVADVPLGVLLSGGIDSTTITALMQGPTTLLQVIAMSAGTDEVADTERIQLFRVNPDGKKEAYFFNIDAIRKGEAPDPLIKANDIVVVHKDGGKAFTKGFTDTLRGIFHFGVGGSIPLF